MPMNFFFIKIRLTAILKAIADFVLEDSNFSFELRNKSNKTGKKKHFINKSKILFINRGLLGKNSINSFLNNEA